MALIEIAAAELPSDETTRTDMSRLTIALKVAAILSVALTLAFLTTVSLQIISAGEYLLDAAYRNNATVTKLLGEQMAGAVRWKKTEVIEAVYADLAKAPDSTLAALQVYDAEGAVLTSFRANPLAADLSSTAQAAKDSGTANRRVGDQILTAVVLTTGAERNKVGTLAVAWSLAPVQAELNRQTRNGIIQALVTLGLLIAAGAFILQRLVGRPLTAMSGVMRRLAAGDLTVEIPGGTRRDEIGLMAHAVAVFKDNAAKMGALQVEREQLAREAAAERRRARNLVANDFSDSVGGVVDTVSSAASGLREYAQSMAAAAEVASRQSLAVATSSEEATANVNAVAAASEQLSTSIGEISQQVAQSAQIAARAVEDTTRTNATVLTLAENARKISEVVELINDIASQTNMLALNATIEAARAGENGKGFAVVATEVKSLASQTARATEEISTRIGAIQVSTKDAVDAIRAVGSTIAEISTIATAVAAAVEQQGSATKEIARNVHQAASATQDVSSNIAQVNKAAAETGTMADQMLKESGALASQSDTLRTAVDGFLAHIRKV